MHKITYLYGLAAGGVLVVFNTVSEWFVEPVPENYDIAEVIGYAGIALSLSLIFFLIRRYRDEIGRGMISFGRALGVGLVADFIASAVYGVFMILYFTRLRPEFIQEYMAHYREKIQNSGESAEVVAAQLNALDADMALWTNPYFNSFVMFATVFLVGALISLVSAAILRRRAD